MNDDKEMAAGVVQTPEAANVVSLQEASKSVSGQPRFRKATAPNPDHPAALLRHAWRLLPVRARGTTLAKIILGCGDTQASRTHMAELTADLRMVVRDASSGRVVAESAPLLSDGKGPRE